MTLNEFPDCLLSLFKCGFSFSYAALVKISSDVIQRVAQSVYVS